MKRKLVFSFREALLFTTLVSLVPALSIIIATGIEHGRHLENTVRMEAARQVESIGELQNERVASIRRVLETLVRVPALRSGDERECRDVLEAFVAAHPNVLNVSLVDRQGIVAASPGLPSGTDLSDRKHIRDAIGRGSFVAGEYVLARVRGIPSFPYAVPVRDFDGTVVGALGVVYPLVGYSDFFDRLELPEETVLGIVDHTGVRLAFHPFKETNPVGLPIDPVVWEGISTGGDAGTVSARGSDGIRRYYAYRRLFIGDDENPYLYVVLGYPERVASGAARQVLLRNLLLMGLVVLVAVGVVILLGTVTFGRRFNRLVTTAGLIQDGDLTARTGIPPDRTELSLLAGAIDEMVVRLEERNREKLAEEQRLTCALKEKEVLLREIHHRVKNNMQLILSILHLQRPSIRDLDLFCENLENRIGAMSEIHEMLYESPDVARIDVGAFIERLGRSAARLPIPAEIRVQAEVLEAGLGSAIPLALIANELITNALKYGAREDGRTIIEVVLARDESELVLHVNDSGPGFPPGFDVEKGSGLGLVLVKALSKQLGGIVATGSGSGFRGSAPAGGAAGARVTVRVAAERVLGDGRAASLPKA